MTHRMLIALLMLGPPPSLLAGQAATPKPLIVGETFTIDSRCSTRTRAMQPYGKPDGLGLSKG